MELVEVIFVGQVGEIKALPVVMDDLCKAGQEGGEFLQEFFFLGGLLQEPLAEKPLMPLPISGTYEIDVGSLPGEAGGFNIEEEGRSPRKRVLNLSQYNFFLNEHFIILLIVL